MRVAIIAVIAAFGLLVAGGSTAFAQTSEHTPGLAPDVEVITERMLFTRGPNGPRVLHMIQLVNIGPRLAQQVPLTVPEGAVWLDVPEELTPLEGVVVDPRPLPAGEARQYVLTYELPWRRLPMPIRRSLFYPTAVLEVWVETDALIMRGVNLRPVAEEEIGGMHFTVLLSTDLRPHPQWQAVLETTTGAGARATQLERIGQRSDPLDIVRAHPLPGLLLLAAGLLAAGAIIAGRLNARKTASAALGFPEDSASSDSSTTQSATTGSATTGSSPTPSGSSAASTAASTAAAASAGGVSGRVEVARLKEEIVQVDVAFHNGELDEGAYLERRDTLKRKLLELMHGQSGAGERSS